MLLLCSPMADRLYEEGVFSYIMEERKKPLDLKDNTEAPAHTALASFPEKPPAATQRERKCFPNVSHLLR